MITKENIQRLAKLSRIDITSKEAESLTGEIDSILNYVSIIQNISGEEVKEIPKLRNVMREDIVTHASLEYTDAILANVPEKDGNYLKVKKILK